MTVKITTKGMYKVFGVDTEFKTPQEVLSFSKQKGEVSLELDMTPPEKLKFWVEAGLVKDLFIDCGQGDKFQVTDVDIDQNTGSLQLRICKGSLGWIKMDVTHPIRLTNDGHREIQEG